MQAAAGSWGIRVDSFHWNRTIEKCINSFWLVSQQSCQLRGIVFSLLAAWPCLTEQWLLISQARVCVCVCVCVLAGNRWVAGGEEGSSGTDSQSAWLAGWMAVYIRSMSWRKVRRKGGKGGWCFWGEACLWGHFDIKELFELYVAATLPLPPLASLHSVASQCFCFIDDDVPCWAS